MAKERIQERRHTTRPGADLRRRLLAIADAPYPALEQTGRAQGIFGQVGAAQSGLQQRIGAWITKHEAAAHRFLATVPGVVAWSLILTPFLLARRMPLIPILLAILYQAYWLSRTVTVLVCGGIGRMRIRAHSRINWRERYEAERAAGRQALPWKKVYHLIIIANYSEPVAKLRASLEALARQRDVASHIWVVLAMEAREAGAAEKAEALQREFRDRLGAIEYTLHPAGIPGEAAGKGSNEAWAARWARTHFVDELGYNTRHITITSCDVDSVFHPNYFACLTYKFATDPGRYLRFWQAPLLFYNNIWQVPTFIQLVVGPAGLWNLANLVHTGGEPFPISTYSASLTLIDGVGYWDPAVISEDWHIFLKCFYRRGGRVRCDAIYLPVTADAPHAPTLWRTATNRYQQAKRHAWGAEDIAYVIRMSLQRADIPMAARSDVVWKVARHHVLSSTSWFIVTFGIMVPSLVSPSAVAAGPALVMTRVFAVLGFALAVLSPALPLLDILLRPPRPRGGKWWRTVGACLQWGLMPAIMFFFGALPSIDAQTRLMCGEKLAYRVTEKA